MISSVSSYEQSLSASLSLVFHEKQREEKIALKEKN